jgi:hypothetical protein
LPANQAPRFGRHTASSFFAGKPSSNGRLSTLWERCLPAIRATRSKANRVQPYRGQAPLPQTIKRPLERGLSANQGHTASSFFAGKPCSNRRLSTLWERCLPAMRAARSKANRVQPYRGHATLPQTIKRPLERGLPANQGHTASSFIAGKPSSNGRLSTLWERCLPAMRAAQSKANRVQPYRGQAALPQTIKRPLERGLSANQGHTASSFFAGKPGSTRLFPLRSKTIHPPRLF